MDFTKVPIGFGMELAQDEKAMQRYAILAKEEKRALLKRARSARSKTEMRTLVSSIASDNSMH